MKWGRKEDKGYSDPLGISCIVSKAKYQKDQTILGLFPGLASCIFWQVTLLNKARDMGPSSFQIPGRFRARDRLFPLTFPLLSTGSFSRLRLEPKAQ